MLKDYTPANGDSYYRAVLQNLFFATHNTKTGDRQFGGMAPTPKHMMSNTEICLRRYAKLIAQPEVLTAWLDKTPFVNGGLFDCLDGHKSKKQGGGGRVDCFSDNPTHQKMLSIPNRVFFGEKEAAAGCLTFSININSRWKKTPPSSKKWHWTRITRQNL